MRGLVKGILVSLVTVVLGLGLSELGIRAYFGGKFAYKTPWLAVDPDTIVRVASNLNDTYYGPDFHMTLATDRFGYRVGPLGPVKGEERGLVLLLGDSYIFGWGVEGGQTLASHLDQVLSESGIRVVNAGVPGHGTLAMAEQLKRLKSQFPVERIRAIVVFHSNNDTVDNVHFAIRKSGHSHPGEALKREATRHISAAAVSGGPRHLSCWHMVNLIRDLGRRPGVKSMVKEDTTLWLESLDALSEEELLAELDVFKALERASKGEPFTPVQRELLELGVRRLHQEADGLVVHHVVLNIDRRSEAFGLLLARSLPDSTRPGVLNHGLLTVDVDLPLPRHNKHSGGHFSPEFNRYCADRVLDLLGLQRI